jgi:hypothetical protein
MRRNIRLRSLRSIRDGGQEVICSNSTIVHWHCNASFVITPNHSANMRSDRSMIVRLPKYPRRGNADLDLIALALTTASLYERDSKHRLSYGLVELNVNLC